MRVRRSVQRKLASLSAQELLVLQELLEGKRAKLIVKGEPYAVRFNPTRFQVLDFSSHEHTVMYDKCSCEDFRFRGRRCKHLAALELLYASDSGGVQSDGSGCMQPLNVQPAPAPAGHGPKPVAGGGS